MAATQPVAPAQSNRAEWPAGPRGALWQTARYVHNPLRFYMQCAQEFGSLFTVPTVLGRLVVISKPSHLRTLFSLPPAAFARWSEGAVEPLLGKHSLLLASGDEHLQKRRLMAPAFHNDRNDIPAMAARMVALTHAHADTWPRGESFKLQDKLVDLSIEVILGVVLGPLEPARMKRLREAILATLAASGPVLMLARAIHERLAAWGPYPRFKRARDRLDRLLYEEIDAAIATPRNASMLDSLVAIRREAGQPVDRLEMRDEVMTLLFAGHETSAIALTWGVYWLSRNPVVRERLRAELATPEAATVAGLVKLPYLDAVCRETLRLHPTVPEVIRLLKAPLQLDDLLLPAGIPVAACIVATHHREDLYPDPGSFRPERFLERSFGAHEFLPFGGGVRRCVGESLAWLEMKTILATLVRDYRFQLASMHDVTPSLRSITMEPRGGVPVIRLAHERQP
jgi:cytochrome P450 family 110